MSRLHVGWAAVAALGTALVGCSGNASPQTMPVAGWGELGPDSVSGTVRQVGNLPFPRTLVGDGGGEQIFVTGDLESEITRLAGMLVRVTGSFTKGDQPGPYILATSYEILGDEENPAAVGILSQDEEGFYLRLFDGAAYRLSQVPPELEGATGAKLWVMAAVGGHVRGYGILKEPAE
jgi:hypothetical protein